MSYGVGVTAYKRKQEEVRGSWESYPAMTHVRKGSRLCKVVQSRKVLTKLIGVLKPKSLSEKSHISQEQACLYFPCCTQSLAGTSSLEGWPQHQSLDRRSRASGANSQLIILPKADVRGHFHDLHNTFSQLLYLHKTKYCNKSLSFSWVNKRMILFHTHKNQILLQISETYCRKFS